MNKGVAGELDIHRLLQAMIQKAASDLHLTVDSPPALRIDGSIYTLKTANFTRETIELVAYSLMNEQQKMQFEQENEIDFSFSWRDQSRFRANFFRQQGNIAGSLRKVPDTVKPISELGVPSAANELIEKKGGLVLVTGPTGSGKSTTLASLIDGYNSRHRGHILTVEDPIEFVHTHKRCVVNQREVGTDTATFATAMRYVLRQDPDLVLIGEVRDLDTMEALLGISETGHLAFGTLHTNSCIQTIHRILDFFPARQQDMVRTQLSFVIEGIICQQLVPRADGRGRVMACELLLPNAAIRNLIREDKTHQIYSQMQMGQGKHGMQTMNQSLQRLVQQSLITSEAALQHSYDVDELTQMLLDSPRARR